MRAICQTVTAILLTPASGFQYKPSSLRMANKRYKRRLLSSSRSINTSFAFIILGFDFLQNAYRAGFDSLSGWEIHVFLWQWGGRGQCSGSRNNSKPENTANP